MTSLSDYSLLEKVTEFDHLIVFRAQKKNDDQPVLIKHYKTQFSSKQISLAKRRLASIKKMKSDVIAAVVDNFVVDDRLTIVYEDAGDMFLSVLALSAPLSIVEFIKIAISITQNLGLLHQKQIIHNDLCPHNIVVDQKTGSARFTGMTLQEIPNGRGRKIDFSSLLEVPYLYTSPEQTGRINWAIDQRSDLYSLGVVFYEMLCRRPPFEGDDPRTMIRQHLASEPESIQKRRQDLPAIIEQMIFKLLSKSPEDRYQSAFGLVQDLKICREQFNDERKIEIFKLGQHDNIYRILIPSKLYGAEENIATLVESFNRVCSGSVEMMIVKGGAGIGKTSLVRELLDAAELKSAFVAQGRCEKEYRDTPYHPLIKSFQMLVKEILRGDEAFIEKWKNRFQENFARNGQLVIDFIPEMKQIIGDQPKLPKLDPVENQNRLLHVFRRFLQAFTLDGKPLVVFLDSFHWVDSATIMLLQAALSDINSKYIQVVISFEERLIIHAHGLSVALDEIMKSGTHIQEITVLPLTLDDVSLLIEEALSYKQDFKPLALLLLDKTKGNPYFVKQLLQYYYENDLIFFDATVGRWSWNITDLEKEDVSDEVADLLEKKIAKLPASSIYVIKLASCIGNQFDVNLLAKLAGQKVAAMRKLLKEPIRAGLIRPVRESAKRGSQIEMPYEPDDLRPFKIFRFTHGKVIQAASSQMKKQERAAIHLQLGRLQIKTQSADKVAKETYRIVNQMNQGADLIQERSERHALARLNLVAGNMSRTSAAFDSARKYFTFGTGLLSEDSWDSDYDLTKELYLRRSDCAYFIGSTAEAEPIFDVLLRYAKTNSERVEVIDRKLNLYIKNNMFEQAIQVGLEALENLFQEGPPPNDSEVNIVAQMQMQDIQLELEQKKIESLLFLPVMVDEDKIAMMELISNIIPAVQVTRKNLWIYLTLKMVETSLRFGNTDSSAFGYMNYAVVLCSGLKDYESGYTIGKLALDLNEKFNNVQLISQLNFLFGSYINHWKVKARENIIYLKQSYQAGIEYGDYLSAANSIDFLMRTLIMVGEPLEEIDKEAKRHQDFIEQLNNEKLKSILEISKQISLLRENSFVDSGFVPDDKLSRRFLEILKKKSESQMIKWYYLVTAKIHYYFYDYKKALNLILESDEIVGSFSQLDIPEHIFYFCLIVLDSYSDFSIEDKKRFWDSLKVNQQKLTEFAERCPNNFIDKAKLIEAMMAGVSGNFVQAVSLYDEAIQLATESGFVQNEALSKEAAAKYYYSRNQMTVASAYLREACQAYIRWGALAKLRHLESYYPDLLVKRRRYDDKEELTEADTKRSQSLNFQQIINASQSISAEVILERMVEKLLYILIENTRADKIFFIVDVEGRLKIMAEGSADREPQVALRSDLLEESQNIAQSIVFYVIRTRKLVALDDACKEGMFAYDNYIRENRPKSVLCIPVINHGKLSGVVYLENSEEKEVFSPKQVDLLTILISQVSISLENSMLYANLAEITEQLSSSKSKLERRIQVLEQELASKIF